ncbi:putative lipoprotein YiaD precursor [compost metagenome]|jgi:OOP family OmpA-OmpF porin
MGGYTDNTGDASLNKTLSNDRANAAMQELVKLGIDANRLSAEGYGPEHPIASNDTPEGRAKNRRIDVRVSQK